MLFVKKLAGTNGWPVDNIPVYTAFHFYKLDFPPCPSLYPTPLFINFCSVAVFPHLHWSGMWSQSSKYSTWFKLGSEMGNRFAHKLLVYLSRMTFTVTAKPRQCGKSLRNTTMCISSGISFSSTSWETMIGIPSTCFALCSVTITSNFFWVALVHSTENKLPVWSSCFAGNEQSNFFITLKKSFVINTYPLISLWWVDPDWMPGAHQSC